MTNLTEMTVRIFLRKLVKRRRLLFFMMNTTNVRVNIIIFTVIYEDNIHHYDDSSCQLEGYYPHWMDDTYLLTEYKKPLWFGRLPFFTVKMNDVSVQCGDNKWCQLPHWDDAVNGASKTSVIRRWTKCSVDGSHISDHGSIPATPRGGEFSHVAYTPYTF